MKENVRWKMNPMDIVIDNHCDCDGSCVCNEQINKWLKFNIRNDKNK